MTNNEFWLSIREIIDNDFSDEGLTKLDEYAEQFISGRLVYKRFSPAEQHGCDEGGTSHVIASILAGAEVGSDKCTAPIGSFKREQQCGAVQERRVLASEPTSATSSEIYCRISHFYRHDVFSPLFYSFLAHCHSITYPYLA